jgi:hypothetical protein
MVKIIASKFEKMSSCYRHPLLPQLHGLWAHGRYYSVAGETEHEFKMGKIRVDSQ